MEEIKIEEDRQDKIMAILMELYDDQTGIEHEYREVKPKEGKPLKRKNQ